MKFARDAFALLFLGVDNLAGSQSCRIINCFEHHIEGAGELIGLEVDAGHWRSYRTFACLDAVHDPTQVFKGAKCNLEDNKIESYADEPANNNENGQRGRRCQSLARVVEIRGKPGSTCGTDEDNQTISEKHFIEYWQAQQRSEYFRYATAFM